jgi:hypothetical protein
MKKQLLVAGIAWVTWASLASLVPAGAADEAKGAKVEYQVHNGYFEKNNSGLKGEASYLAFTDQKAYDQVFGAGVVMGKKQNFLPKGAFDSKMVVAVIKRGNKIWEYKVEKVTAEGGVLYVQYTATSKDGGSATFASPLIVSVDKGKYQSVVLLEDGKKVGAADIGK